MRDRVEAKDVTVRAAVAGSGAARRLRERAVWLGLATLLAGLCLWRLACVQAGPDPDTDAYGHYLIAQQLLETPWNFRIHWVWLPLYHVLSSLPVALGASLDHVRSANAVAAAGPALLLLWASRRRAGTREPVDSGVALLAALLTALNPLLLQLGTTGQMEVFFCLLLLLTATLLSQQRFGAAALALSALVLTRYEAWAVAAVVGVELVRQHVAQRRRLGPGEWACLIAPASCVLGWATLRWLGGEPWFGFLADNQAFAERALGPAPSRGMLHALTRYTLVVPFHAFGLALPFALLGVGRTWRQHGTWFVAPGLAIVGLLTLSSLSRSQLGLERHFLSVVPFAATWIAQGVARAEELVAAALAKRWAPRRGAAFALLGLCVVAGSALRLRSTLPGWWELTETRLRAPRQVAEFLRGTPASSLIVCNQASVEVLSELDPTRFVHAPLDAHTADRVREWSRSRDVFIVGRARRLGAFSHVGAASYGALDGPADAFVAIHVPAGSGIGSNLASGG